MVIDKMDLFDISRQDIEEIADSQAILQRGRRYYSEGRVKHIEFDKAKESITAVVEGDSGTYGVRISIGCDDIDDEFGSGEDSERIEAECTCPYGLYCKHIVAALYKWLDVKDNLSGRAGKRADKKTGLMSVTFDEIKESANKETLLKAFDLLKSGSVIIKSKDAETVVADVIDGEKESVFFKRSKTPSYFDALYNRCSCGLGTHYDKCAHTIAVLLKVFTENKPNYQPLLQYESKIRSEIQNEKYSRLVGSLRAIEPESKITPQRYDFFIYAERQGKSILLSVKKRAILKKGGLGKPSNSSEYYLKQSYSGMSDAKRGAIQFFLSANKNQWGSEAERRIKSDSKDILDIELLRRLRELYKKEPECFEGCVFPDSQASVDMRIQNHCTAEHYSFDVYARIGERTFNIGESFALVIGEGPLWVFVHNFQGRKACLAELNTNQPQIVKSLAMCSSAKISPERAEKFIEDYYLKLSAAGNVVLPEKYAIEERMQNPVPRIFLKDHEDIFRIELRFLYSSREAAHGTDSDIVLRENNRLVKIKRNKAEEAKYFSILLANRTAEKNGVLIPSVNPYEWLADTARNLISSGFEIYGIDKLFNQRLAASDPKLAIAVSSGIDWFDLNGSFECGGERIPLGAFLEAAKNGERFIKLSDGRMGAIPKKWIEKISGVAGFLQHDKAGEKITASPSQIAIIEALLDIADRSDTDDAFKKIREKFAGFKKIKSMPLPEGLNGELRRYQKAGYDWLHFLREFSFGGCLADEMGLGKTLQVLALLAYEKEQGNKKPSLIVVPTSLVFNWAAEANKFTPRLKVHIHHGQERARDCKEIIESGCDIIVTTYGTLRNDIDFFKDYEFHYIVLDESQQIKNPLSKNARSAYSLKSKYRLALTGTPVENNSLELWSQFAFLNPGLLGNMDYFRETFAKSIEKDKDKDKMASLKNIIDPFLLRRKKETVALDLPEKQITTLYCDMDGEQRKTYDFWKDKYRKDIYDTIQEKGFLQSRMKILEGLTKLRQICNHPVLVDESYAGVSGKFDALTGRIEEVIGEGHKALVFSSFVKMLNVFRRHFDGKGIKYSYLDGGTTNRKEVVEEFQRNEKIPVFLISLKAGGLGLNLTSADYVFIVDPWWNPAAEMQAIDRAHRIGQKNNVFVYKAITKDSVEEKILELQETKLDLVKNVIAANEGIFKKLNKENIDRMFA